MTMDLSLKVVEAEEGRAHRRGQAQHPAAVIPRRRAQKSLKGQIASLVKAAKPATVDS